jgi:hypothetical protein
LLAIIPQALQKKKERKGCYLVPGTRTYYTVKYKDTEKKGTGVGRRKKATD